MPTLKYLIDKYELNINEVGPTEIPNVSRETMAKWLNELGFKEGVEVGVAEGIYSKVLCEENPQMNLTCVDKWETYDGYNDYKISDTLEGLRKKFIERMSSTLNYRVLRKWSIDAAKDFKDGSLDCVYLDANHEYPFVIQDLETWYPKVREGGIIAGHDFIDIRGCKWGVKKAVKRFVEEKEIHPWFIIGREANDRGEIREKYRSWMIIK